MTVIGDNEKLEELVRTGRDGVMEAMTLDALQGPPNSQSGLAMLTGTVAAFMDYLASLPPDLRGALVDAINNCVPRRADHARLLLTVTPEMKE